MKKKGNNNSFYLTNRHEAIKERVKGWDKQGISHSHWQGFDRQCTETQKKNDAKKGMPISTICQGCSNRKTCEYPKQFKGNERIFAPSSYLSTSHFKKKAPLMKTITIDESITNIETCTVKPKIIEDVFKAINVSPNYIQELQQKNYLWFYNKLPQRIQHIRIQLDAFIKNPNSDLSKLKGFNLQEFEKFIEWHGTYHPNKINRTSYGIPLYYYSFDALKNQQNLKLVILDASFNKELLQYFLEAYNGEKKFNRPITVQIYKTNEANKDTIVFRMRPKAWFPHSSLTTHIDETRTKIKESIKQIRRVFGEENVGIITFKDIGISKDIGDVCDILNFNLEYYGNLRSSNKFEDKPVIILIGTYFPPLIELDDNGNPKMNGIIKDLDRYFLWKAPKNAVQEVKTRLDEIQDKAYKKQMTDLLLGNDKPRYLFPGTGCNDISIGTKGKDFLNPVYAVTSRWKDEMYQAFHRNRGLQHNRIIFAYCWIPMDIHYDENEKDITKKIYQESKIKDEFDVKEIKIKEEKDLFDSLKLQLGNRQFIHQLMNGINQDLTDTEIAKKEKVNRKYDKNTQSWIISSNKVDKSRGPASNYIHVFREGLYRRDYGKVKAKYSIKKFLKR
jgi:hypothetical protein